MHTAELNFSNFVIEYIGKIETEFENTCSSGAQMGSNHKKMEVENLVTHSLKRGSVTRFFLFHESKPSGPLINRLNWFCLKVHFRGDICEKFDSAQC